jgi:cyanate permease
MQRVWITVLSVWAMLAIVAVLAWTHRPAPVAQPQATPQTLVVQTPNGKRQVVVLQPGAVGAAHATTHTSGAPR